MGKPHLGEQFVSSDSDIPRQHEYPRDQVKASTTSYFYADDVDAGLVSDESRKPFPIIVI